MLPRGELPGFGKADADGLNNWIGICFIFVLMWVWLKGCMATYTGTRAFIRPKATKLDRFGDSG